MTAPDRLVLRAERLFDGERMHRDRAVVVEGGRIVALGSPGELPDPVADGSLPLAHPPGGLLTPGFVDLQVNGGGGVLLNQQPTVAGIAAIAEAHRRHGTTALLPTLISDGPEVREAALAAAAEAVRTVPGVLGLHLEGPFLNPDRHGAHRRDAIVPMTAADVDRLSRPFPGVLLITLAPERVPAPMIGRLAAAGVRVFAGHTDATFEEMAAAVAAGLVGVTHLFNAMSQLAGRAPGVVGAALAGAVPFAGLIADGHHVHAANVRLAHRAMGPERLALVSDAMPSVGGPDVFTLDGRTIRRTGTRLADEADRLAGAHLCMAGAVRTAVVDMGLPLGDALRMATLTPAVAIGGAVGAAVGGAAGGAARGADRAGRLCTGGPADLVALDADLRVTAVWVDGAPVAAVTPWS